MPRGADFAVPFPSRISAGAGAALARQLDWPRANGLLDTAAARLRHERERCAELAARCHPTATGADLDLAVDQLTWITAVDGVFAGPRGAPERARDLVAALAGVLGHDPRPGAEPVVRAFADLWRRSGAGMSAEWLARAATGWRCFLAGQIEQVDGRHGGCPTGVHDYLRIRRHTVFFQPVLDLAERVGGFEVPPRVLATDVVATLRRLGKNIVIAHQDLRTAGNAVGVGDLVAIVERNRGLSRAGADTVVRELIKRWTTEFLGYERDIPGLCDALGLGEQERAAVERYRVDGLRAIIRATVDWSAQ